MLPSDFSDITNSYILFILFDSENEEYSSENGQLSLNQVSK